MEEKDTLFRKESMEHITTPQQLDSYLMVTRPGWGFLAGALVLALVSVLIWSFVGSVPDTVDVKGYVSDSQQVVAFLPSNEVGESIVGKSVTIISNVKGERLEGIVQSVSTSPYSREEIASRFSSDWLVENLATSPYMYEVHVSTNQILPFRTKSVCDLSILVSEMKPIRYFFR